MFEGQYEGKLEFPEGWRWGFQANKNNTFLINMRTLKSKNQVN